MDFDLNTLRIVVMLLGLVAFLALWRHTWSRQRSDEHLRAALSPFSGDAPPAPAAAVFGSKNKGEPT
ncbi:MAG: hypothetical protein ACOVOT_09330 [Rubrivivax sp.]|jgi:hypothetical protein|nr:hypothetical protein [Rubrivivax sp.]